VSAPPKPPRTERKARRPIARKSRPAKVRKTPRSKLKRMADKLWSQIVRAAGKCRICGSEERLQAAHGFSRSYLGTRWDLRNGWCLCAADHVFYTHRPLEWGEFMHSELGPVLYDELRKQAMARCIPDYEAVIAELKEKS
jgi:hypothetical protein